MFWLQPRAFYRQKAGWPELVELARAGGELVELARAGQSWWSWPGWPELVERQHEERAYMVATILAQTAAYRLNLLPIRSTCCRLAQLEAYWINLLWHYLQPIGYWLSLQLIRSTCSRLAQPAVYWLKLHHFGSTYCLLAQ